MKKTGTEYTKPFGKELFGTETIVHYPYPREQLIAEPIFPYFVLDGGACNLMNDRFGTANGDDILALTYSGKLFEEFTHNGKFNWESSFAYISGTDLKPKYEWQIWPQRLYMTIPLAHAFLKTGEKKYADAWLKIVKAWDEAHPYQEFVPEIHYLQTDMVWRDMQVAWRTMSLLHGLFMLQDAPFCQEEWKYLYDFVELHMRHMYIEALDRLARNHAQNHVLQIGVVLLMAGIMFPEFENAVEIIKIGRDTVEMNMRGAIYKDGGSNEDSPSYSHFIVRLYLEALLLLEKNGLGPIEGLRESIKKQYEWIYQCMSPTGHTLRLSDSYGMDAMADLNRASELITLDFPREKKSMLFPDSQIAVLRKGSITLFADAMEYLRGHQHAGRPQILMFYDNEPVLVDAGCCSYDRWEFYVTLMSSKMHNVVYCPDFADDKCTIQPKITGFDADKGIIALTSHVRNENISYHWERTLTLEEDKLMIEDIAHATEPINWASRLFLARNDTKTYEDKHTVCQLTNGYLMKLTSDVEITTELVPVMNDSNNIDYSVVVQTSSHGECFKMRTVIAFTKR